MASLFPAGRARTAVKTVIGVVHLLPLPGAPRWAGSMRAVVRRALADARAYECGGTHALILENFGDVPFSKAAVAPETVAAMAVVGSAVRAASQLPIGFNVLRNDAHAALALCVACGGSFVRVNVHTGAMITDQGIIEGDASHTLRLRTRLGPTVAILADVHVKHAAPLADVPISLSARDTLERGLADAVIVSGTGTGTAPDLDDLQEVRRACPHARVLIGSGASSRNVRSFLRHADGIIVGSSLKKAGQVENPVDARRVRDFVRAIQR